jgi:hypothetical protein
MCKNEKPFTLELTEMEARIAMKTVTRFAKSLVLKPDSDERLQRISLGCTPDVVIVGEFGEVPFGDHVNIRLDVDSLSGGRLKSVVLPEFHVLLFHEPHGEKAFEALTHAVLWERDRQRNGEKPGVHEKELIECLAVAAQCARDNMKLLVS